MAGGMDLGTGGKSKKKALDTTINLVPFIDLMAVTISFLIMTAVWTQVSMLSVSQVGGPSSDEDEEVKTKPLNLVISEKGFTISSPEETVDVPRSSSNGYVYCHSSGKDKIDDKCDEKSLIGVLKKFKIDLPDQRTITVQCEDSVRYEDLVRVIDICNTTDANNQPVLFPDVTVSAVG
jgi:biopolymer transport protein ExbD